jgi:hypothetical protein
MKLDQILLGSGFAGAGKPVSSIPQNARPTLTSSRFNFSRRHFFGAAAGLAAGLGKGSSRLALAAGHPAPPLADADDGPQHIPGGFVNPALPKGCPSEVLHFFGPGPTNENSTVWDFNGFIGVTAGTVSGTGNRAGVAQSFTGVDVDMRFMKGSYVGLDGNLHRGAFAFI